MKKKKGKNSVFKRIAVIGISVYVIVIFIQQQSALNSYKQQEEYYISRLNEEKAKTESLEQLKSVYSTDEYVERIARDKLGLVKPDEKVFIDASNR